MRADFGASHTHRRLVEGTCLGILFLDQEGFRNSSRFPVVVRVRFGAANLLDALDIYGGPL